MWKKKLSKEFAFTVIGILALWFLGPHILFSAGEKSRESQIQTHLQLLEERRENVAASLETLQIADANFLACISAAADELARIHPTNSGGIDDVRELENLYCPRRKILSIQGIEKIAMLKFLNVSNNYIEDIAPLRENTALKSLRLDGNPIQDISPLKDLERLVDVSLPELPKASCGELKRIFGGTKNNIESTGCRKKTVLTGEQSGSQNTTPNRQKQESYKLNLRQEEEILDYEFDLQRRFD